MWLLDNWRFLHRSRLACWQLVVKRLVGRSHLWLDFGFCFGKSVLLKGHCFGDLEVVRHVVGRQRDVCFERGVSKLFAGFRVVLGRLKGVSLEERGPGYRRERVLQQLVEAHLI